MLWASGQVNADLQAIEKALQASGSKVGYFVFLLNVVSIKCIYKNGFQRSGKIDARKSRIFGASLPLKFFSKFREIW